MKNFNSYFKLFLLGFLAAFIVFNLTMCPEESAGPDDNNNNTGSESKELKEFVSKAESAFNSGSKENILKITFENNAEILTDYLPNDPVKIKKFGEAFSNKKLIFANQNYAEYELTIEGTSYTIAMGNSGDGNWKLIRF